MKINQCSSSDWWNKGKTHIIILIDAEKKNLLRINTHGRTFSKLGKDYQYWTLSRMWWNGNSYTLKKYKLTKTTLNNILKFLLNLNRSISYLIKCIHKTSMKNCLLTVKYLHFYPWDWKWGKDAQYHLFIQYCLFSFIESKEAIILSLSADDMVVLVENHKSSTDKL